MLNRAFVARKVSAARPELSETQIHRLIDDAVRMLSNLVHYKSGASHEDDDVVTAVLVIGQDRQEY